jgi:hypothetical protein
MSRRLDPHPEYQLIKEFEMVLGITIFTNVLQSLVNTAFSAAAGVLALLSALHI